MIIILTSNYDAGILQLALQMKKEFEIIGGSTVLFVPEQANLNNLDGIETYKRKNSLFPFSQVYSSVSERINRYAPTLVYVCDTNLITARIVMGLAKDVPIYMTVHDVEAHPSYNSLSRLVLDKLKAPYKNLALKRANRIVLMSKHSFNMYKKKKPHFAFKLSLIRLGAHIPDANEKELPELSNEDDYILFFGRLDKYKGIINLLNAYEINKNQINHKIVIAGNGTVTEEEQIIINNYPEAIRLVKRYITDSEMIWLFKHANCTVLPYIEASQSGVLSMSYYFGKPVIVSDLEGLTEFVENEKTGVVFHSVEELAEELVRIPKQSSNMSEDIKIYYNENLDWTNNIKSCIKTDMMNLNI